MDFLAGRTGKKKSELRIAVGHDSRISAGALKKAIFSALTYAGCVAVDCSLASTPAMFMATVFPETKMDGTIMITASHLPFNRNGMKFFTKEGGVEHADIEAILKAAVRVPEFAGDLGKVQRYSLMERYCHHLRKKIRQGIGIGETPLKGMHIVVDAGNGAGGFFATQVLGRLGADTSGSVFLEPDGHFPNHIPNPENHQAMAAIKKAVLDARADFGLIFDTDVDRMGAVLKNGKEIELTPIEFSLVKFFMGNANKAVHRDEILNNVWGTNYVGDFKIVDVNIRRIRQKIEEDPSHPKYIEKVWGYGYRWWGGE